jgi:tuberculosinol/isotuberculosinol synthase
MDPFILPMSAPQLSEWLRWPTERVARWITADSQPVVMGWPFNGTRRWYLAYRRQDLNARDYLTTLTRRQAELNRMIFAHGIDTILTPLFGSELLGRGSAYTQYVLSGLSQLADDEVYQEMFAAGVRIRFYGDYEEMLDAPIFRPTLEACASS